MGNLILKKEVIKVIVNNRGVLISVDDMGYKVFNEFFEHHKKDRVKEILKAVQNAKGDLRDNHDIVIDTRIYRGKTAGWTTVEKGDEVAITLKQAGNLERQLSYSRTREKDDAVLVRKGAIKASDAYEIDYANIYKDMRKLVTNN